MPREPALFGAVPIIVTDERRTRFQGRIERVDSGCWLWRGYVGKEGYGTFSVGGGKKYLAHRFAYAAFVGPIPDGLTIDHVCRTRACVNPEHLEPVLIRDNVLRAPTSLTAIAAAKSTCKRGHSLDGIQMSRGRPTRYCKTCSHMRSRAHGTGVTGELRYSRGHGAR